MPVKIKRCFGRLMPQQCADCLNIDTQFQQTGGKAMTQRMKMYLSKSQRLHLSLKTALNCARLCGVTSFSKDEYIGMFYGYKSFFQHRK